MRARLTLLLLLLPPPPGSTARADSAASLPDATGPSREGAPKESGRAQSPDRLSPRGKRLAHSAIYAQCSK